MFFTFVNKSKRLLRTVFNRSRFVLWVEAYLFYPTSLFQRFLSYLFLPLSALYCAIVLSKRFFGRRRKLFFTIPIISIGNLTVGGNGKTPFCIALAKNRDHVAIVLRGYGRKSHGLILVSDNGQIMCDAPASGDEAMLYAKSLPKSTVIVSEDRVEAIRFAKKKGAKIVFLDDGFSKSFIHKIDILVKPNPEPANNFCLPSGPYREPRFLYQYADLVISEDMDFKRHVEVINPSERMLLVTAISKPSRLDAYLPDNVVGKVSFEDHYMYSEKELEILLHEHKATTILTTQKDAVKMATFDIPLSLLKLEVEIFPETLAKINTLLAPKR
ncbi:tetraacyldisaccharide 4'-kinase [Sulfurospirillum diekertiae]|uniref:Tetraacyldisaccharide 4'-kinase n=1 Tax=Sulfurospirillum diekertiae TaxID=1854492 RepID=A0A6G9VP25_9BACT|nr:tetraacyldisaccharide 4'-kinase [Sulfurospirillum diekertiae]QIR77551.1 tetraacyldisaccharide 4'-kinase [Sulfurospirillum diekertiae]